jgi:two-component system NtrC family sensor kinase
VTAAVELVVPVVGAGTVAERAAVELAAVTGVEVARVDDATALAAWLGTRGADTGRPDLAVPATLLVDPDDLAAAVERVASLPAGPAPPAILVVTGRAMLDELSDAVDRGRLAGLVGPRWRHGQLAAHVRSHVARWLSRADVELPATWRDAATDVGGPWVFDSDLLADLELDDHTLAVRLTEALDAALGPRPRLRLAAGTRLTRQDVEVNGVFVVLRGTVALDRDTEVGEVRLHHRSTGPVVGLLSLAQQRRAFFTARATTDVEVIHLTVEQLDLALERSTAVGAALAAGSVRALAARLRRSEQLQVERRRLHRDLEQERARLQDAYAALEAARLELVEQARFATLGELAAGVAHELNNPTAAIARATAHLLEDVLTLVGDQPAGRFVTEVVELARTRPPASPADERRRRRDLREALRDDGLARRLAAAGVRDGDEARALLARARHDVDAATLAEHAAGLGAAVRNLTVATERVVELVDSLRAYARPDGTRAVDVDVHESLEDTLRLVAHRLQGVEVERRYGELPPVRGHPGQLGQVWTNLLVNAAEALDGQGRIVITTDRPSPHDVRVRVADDGPGVDSSTLARLFEPRFTTKDGAVRYGLGLGLPIAKRIVEAHGGTIALTAGPDGGTLATVILPVGGPDDEEAPA